MNISKNTFSRIQKFIRIAKAMKESNQTGKNFHCTFVVKKRKLLIIGVNNYNKVIDSKRFGIYKSDKPDDLNLYKAGLHSELDAIIRLGKIDCNQLDFYNIRINNSNEIASSKPCKNCQRVLNDIGFNSIYYFDEFLNLNIIK